MSKIHVTRLAAIQLVMMQASTSLMLSKDLSMPGMAPHSAPASMPPKKARNQMISGGTTEEGMLSAMNSVAAVPARYCPGAPMLNSPVLNATATERPVRINGVARKSMLPTLAGLKPKVSAPAASRPVANRPAKIRRTPSHTLLRPSEGVHRPTIRIIRLPAIRPTRMDRTDAMTDRVPS